MLFFYRMVLAFILLAGGLLAQDGARRLASAPESLIQLPEPAESRSDEMLVCFDRTIPERASRARVLKSVCGATLRHEFKLVPGLVSVKLPPGLSVSGAWARFKAEKGIRFAQPNYIYRAQSVPNDSFFAYQWNMNNTGQVAGAISGVDIRALKAWGRTHGSTNIIVAVIDSGIRYTHEDLVANMWRNPGETPNNGIDDDHNGYIDDVHGIDVVNNDGDPVDTDGHGTFCAGIIGAAGNNGKGISGVCWDVRLMGLKFMESSSGSTEGAVRCIEYAVAKGAKILNNSWGTGAGTFDPGIKATLDAAGQAGVLCVFPAGNENGINIDEHPVYPACYDSTNIISVMSFDEKGGRANHSNFGAISVDVAAPGTNILTCTVTGNYGYRSGTSMAVPHVSGACALLYALNPQLDWRQVKQIILDSAERRDAFTGLCVTGGRLNLAQAAARVIPEEWLLKHGLSVNGSADNADADADRMTNWDEWFAGTNPTNTFSVLQFEGAATLLTNGNFRVSWQSVPGRRYWIESAEALVSPLAFTPVVSNLLSTASPTEYVDVRPATTSRFYRVGVQAE
jgi:subtilisin family serine protease